MAVKSSYHLPAPARQHLQDTEQLWTILLPAMGRREILLAAVMTDYSCQLSSSPVMA